MTNEQLIEIINKVNNSKDYMLLIDGDTACVYDGWINILGEYGDECSYPLSSLRIIKEHDNGTKFYIHLKNDGYSLQIAKIVDINGLLD